MRLWLQFSVGLLAALALGVPASRAAFTAGFYASPPAMDASNLDVGIDRAGNTLFTWTTPHPVTGDLVVQLRKRSAAGVLSAPQTLSTTGHEAMPPHIAVNGNGASVLVWQIRRGDASATTPVQGIARAANGALSPIFAVSPRPGGNFSFDFANPNVAIDGAGNAIFTWIGLDTTEKRRAYARRRSAGGTFGPILILSPQKVSEVKMAVNAGGAAVFVWVWNDGQGHNQIHARQLSAAGVLGPTKIIGQGLPYTGGGGHGTGNPHVGLDSQGNALIVWEQPDGDGPCGINGCPKVLSRTLSKTGVVATVPQTYSTTDSGGFLPQVSMATDGSALVMWAHAGLEFRTRSAAGGLGPLQKFTLSTSGGHLLKGDQAGNTVALWRNNSTLLARARSSTGTLGAARSFSLAGRPNFGGWLAVGASGKAVVSWGQYDGSGQCFGGSDCSRIGASIGP